MSVMRDVLGNQQDSKDSQYHVNQTQSKCSCRQGDDPLRRQITLPCVSLCIVGLQQPFVHQKDGDGRVQTNSV